MANHETACTWEILLCGISVRPRARKIRLIAQRVCKITGSILGEPSTEYSLGRPEITNCDFKLGEAQDELLHTPLPSGGLPGSLVLFSRNGLSGAKRLNNLNDWNVWNHDRC